MAVYGCYVLATGRVPQRSRAAFRSTRDAGMYSLFGGVGVLLLTLGQIASDAEPILTLSATALALVFMGVAFIRYRPRGRPNSRP